MNEKPFTTGIILNTPVVHGRCVLTVRTDESNYVNAADVRAVEAKGLIIIQSEHDAGYGRTTFVFTHTA